MSHGRIMATAKSKSCNRLMRTFHGTGAVKTAPAKTTGNIAAFSFESRASPQATEHHHAMRQWQVCKKRTRKYVAAAEQAVTMASLLMRSEERRVGQECVSR